MYRIFSFKLFVATVCSFLLLMSFGLGAVQAHTSNTSMCFTDSPCPTSVVHSSTIKCAPTTFEGTAFPYTSTENISKESADFVTECKDENGNISIPWGWITATSATGSASWDLENPGKCDIKAFIPTNHAGAPDAQYFVYDNNQLEGKVLEDQENLSGWVDLGTWTFSTDPVVKLQDLSPSGRMNWQIAASAMRSDC